MTHLCTLWNNIHNDEFECYASYWLSNLSSPLRSLNTSPLSSFVLTWTHRVSQEDSLPLNGWYLTVQVVQRCKFFWCTCSCRQALCFECRTISPREGHWILGRKRLASHCQRAASNHSLHNQWVTVEAGKQALLSGLRMLLKKPE